MGTDVATNELILSIDGGGTKTDACIAQTGDDGRPEVIGRARGGASNLTSLGVGRVISELERVIAAAVEDAGVADRRFQRTIVALAGGADRGRCREIKRWLEEGPCEHVRVVSDAEMILSIAEALAPNGSVAIGLLVGTGSVAFFRKPNALDTQRAGGWGPVLGDDGSGYWIGRAAIRRVLQAADEGRTDGLLATELFQAMEANSPRELVTKVHKSYETTPTIASLAPVVFKAAKAGDQTAREILMEAAIHVGLLVAQVVRRIGASPEGVVVACAGGVITRKSVFSLRVEELIRSGGIKEVHFVEDPAEAAVQLAIGS